VWHLEAAGFDCFPLGVTDGDTVRCAAPRKSAKRWAERVAPARSQHLLLSVTSVSDANADVDGAAATAATPDDHLASDRFGTAGGVASGRYPDGALAIRTKIPVPHCKLHGGELQRTAGFKRFDRRSEWPQLGAFQTGGNWAVSG